MAERAGVTVKDVPSKDFIKAFAQHLKASGKLEVPEWVRACVDLNRAAPVTGSFMQLSIVSRRLW